MVRRFPLVTLITLALVVIVLTTGVPAQQPAPIEAELLSEVRLLRQAIESLTGTNARVQIVFGRLQLQEQRTATAARALDNARSAKAAIAMRAAEAADRIKELEAVVEDTRRKPEEIEALRQELSMARGEAARIEAERTRLMNEEGEAAGTLNQEQGRWSDLNRQLEELERALASPKP